MKKQVPAVLLFCLFAIPTFAQSLEEVRAKNYQKLFTITAGFFDQLPKTCKTQACATLAVDGAALIADGRDKHARGVLVDQERTAWHAKLESALHGSIVELQRDILKKRGEKIPTAALIRPSCMQSAHLATDQCGLCYDVFEQVAEICALYAFVSPEAASHSSLICLAWAAINFGGCIQNYCVWNLNTN